MNLNFVSNKDSSFFWFSPLTQVKEDEYLEEEEEISSGFGMSSDEEVNKEKAAEIEKKKKDEAIFRKKTLTLGEVSDDEAEESEEEGPTEDKDDGDQDDDEGDKKDENMRSMYWAVVHEAQKDIKKANPELTGREVLKRARKVYFDCT